MANIYGTGFWSPHAGRFIHRSDVLYGTASDDYIDAYAGNDTVYAGWGNDTVYGGSGNDYLEASDGSGYYAYWGNDWVSGGSGDDTIDYSRTASAVTLHGDAGTDMVFGGTAGDYITGGTEWDWLQGNEGNDTINGGTGDDYIFGGSENDVLLGDYGVDSIYGESGNDRIAGGADGDWLYGGDGSDTFIYTQLNQSGLTWDTADTIQDFNTYVDRLDFVQAGNQYNFTSRYFPSEVTFDYARDWAAGQIAAGARYAFASGPGQEGPMGYLFADADGNGTMDTGIELAGVDQYTFNYWNIV
jgi:Ca2+-binding RTX toxin-like protein